MRKTAYGLFIRMRRKPKKDLQEMMEFGHILKQTKSILLLVPSEVLDQNECNSFIQNLLDLDKKLTLFMPPTEHLADFHSVSMRQIEYRDTDFGFFMLPKTALIKRLKALSFDMIIDMDYRDYSTISLLTIYPQSRFRIGFNKKFAEKFYNFILTATSNDDSNYVKLLELIKRI